MKGCKCMHQSESRANAARLLERAQRSTSIGGTSVGEMRHAILLWLEPEKRPETLGQPEKSIICEPEHACASSEVPAKDAKDAKDVSSRENSNNRDIIPLEYQPIKLWTLFELFVTEKQV